MQTVFEVNQTLSLFFCQFGHRNPGPAGHDACDVLPIDRKTGLGAFALPVAACLVHPGLHLLFIVAQFGGVFKVLLLDGVFLFLLEHLQLLLDFLDLERFNQTRQPHFGSGFVNQIDGLVGQKPVGDIPRREFDGSLKRRIGDFYSVVRLVTVAQPF
ncbi:hypothetical protein SDC9_211107 [bioreactor metagenome]|uniref:Uncharacterized protein n=1 Tax=bioreactor metagenome TaxID=1076179 RepID=A0A645JKV1_9ZZZZ